MAALLLLCAAAAALLLELSPVALAQKGRAVDTAATGPAAPMASAPTVIAHRGFSAEAPENTLAAFREAIEVGADYVELDVRRSQGDSLMVIHDATVGRTTDGSSNRRVREMTYEELRALDAGAWFGEAFAGEKIPTLAEALALAKRTGIKVAVELKSDGIAGAAVRLVERMGMEEEVILFAFSFENIARIKQVNPDLPVLYLRGRMDRKAVDRVHRVGGEYVGAGGKSDLTPAFLEYAHARDVEVWRWTVNERAEMKALIDLGIDGIITDHPGRLVELLREHGS